MACIQVGSILVYVDSRTRANLSLFGQTVIELKYCSYIKPQNLRHRRDAHPTNYESESDIPVA